VQSKTTCHAQAATGPIEITGSLLLLAGSLCLLAVITVVEAVDDRCDARRLRVSRCHVD
jgi:hypothetical protein